MEVINTVSLNLEKFIKDKLPQEIKNGLEMSGTYVQNEAKGNCGVDTGTLRNSITHEVEDDECTIGSNVEYADYHHTKNPFLQDVADSKMTEIVEYFVKGCDFNGAK